jgi:atypical dual specificity phosphatase
MFAPPLEDLHRGVAFIAEHASTGRVYIHCKAGRGRSTTLLLCYFIEQAGMTPSTAFELIKRKRPQVGRAYPAT